MLESFWIFLGFSASLNSVAQLSQLYSCDSYKVMNFFCWVTTVFSFKEDPLIILARSLQQSASVVARNFKRLRNHLCSFNPVFDRFQLVE